MDLQLRDRVALLVGGGGSIGQAVKQAFAAEGAVPVVADVESAGQSRGGSFVPIDVTDPASVQVCIERVVAEHGKIDILVVLAAVASWEPIATLDPDQWDRVMRINLKGTFLVCRETVPHMQRAGFGRIICFSSLAGQVGGLVAGADYSASKAGVLSLVKSLAKQVQHSQVTVNAVCPGPVEGTMTAAWSPEVRRGMIEKCPVGRFAQPEEIAYAVLFLSSPRAAYLHGIHLDINGGTYMD